jgi:galactose mutarotase-like enzyme
MTVVSLWHAGTEVVAVPGGAQQLRQGRTSAVPLLAPWANRLAGFRFTVAGRAVDVTTHRTRTDQNGLPIHGVLVGAPGWEVTHRSGRGRTARVTAARDVTAAEFAFPHRLEVDLQLSPGCLQVATTVDASLGSPAPVALGWHPYLSLPTPRPGWLLTLPEREHLLLDDHGLPTGATRSEPAEQRQLGRRHFDDLYAVADDARLSFASPAGHQVTLELVQGYRYAQVWVPPRRRYAALEPMSVPTDALTRGEAQMVSTGDRRTLVYALTR